MNTISKMNNRSLFKSIFSFFSIALIAVVFSFNFSSCSKDIVDGEVHVGQYEVLYVEKKYLPIDIPSAASEVPLTRLKLYDLSKSLSNDNKEEFNWEMVSDFGLWSAVKAGESALISIGYDPAVSVFSNFQVSTKDQIIEFILDELNDTYPQQIHDRSDLNIELFKYANVLLLELDDYDILAKLRRLQAVRYVEPESFDLEDFWTAETRFFGNEGCGGDDPVGNDQISREFNRWNNSRVGWQYDANKVSDAWFLVKVKM